MGASKNLGLHVFGLEVVDSGFDPYLRSNSKPFSLYRDASDAQRFSLNRKVCASQILL